MSALPATAQAPRTAQGPQYRDPRAAPPGRGGPACAPSPGRRGSPTPPSRRRCRPRSCRVGGRWSCSSTPWTASAKRFHDLWIAASRSRKRTPSGRTADRWPRAELDAVRRHIETDTGLLLVTGEAGMGKTTLVDTARHEARGTAFVATGRCLPFSGEIPLLPFTQALRQVAEQDEGELLRDAVGSCPAYVQAALSTLLPELSTGGVQTDPEDRWFGRHQARSRLPRRPADDRQAGQPDGLPDRGRRTTHRRVRDPPGGLPAAAHGQPRQPARPARRQDHVAFTGSAHTAELLRTHPQVLHGGVTLGVEADSLTARCSAPTSPPEDPSSTCSSEPSSTR